MRQVEVGSPEGASGRRQIIRTSLLLLNRRGGKQASKLAALTRERVLSLPAGPVKVAIRLELSRKPPMKLAPAWVLMCEDKSAVQYVRARLRALMEELDGIVLVLDGEREETAGGVV